MAHHAYASGVSVCTRAEPRQGWGGFIQLFALKQLKLQTIAAFKSQRL